MADVIGRTFEVRRRVLKLLGAGFRIFDASGHQIAYGELKPFKLKEDIRVYAGESGEKEMLRIGARQALDISATYDVTAADGTGLGALRRQGLRALVRDRWTIIDTSGEEIGSIDEDSTALAIVRRVLSNLVPQRFVVTVADTTVAEMQQAFNPFVYKLTTQFTAAAEGTFDRRLGLAAAVLISAIEGRKD